MEEITSLTAQESQKAISNSTLLQVASGFSILMLVFTVMLTVFYPSITPETTESLGSDVLGVNTTTVETLGNFVNEDTITRAIYETVTYSARNVILGF